MSEKQPSFAGSKYEGMTKGERTMAQMQRIQQHIAHVAYPIRNTKGIEIKGYTGWRNLDAGTTDARVKIGHNVDRGDYTHVETSNPYRDSGSSISMAVKDHGNTLAVYARGPGVNVAETRLPVGSDEARDTAASVLRAAKRTVENIVDEKYSKAAPQVRDIADKM